MTGWQALGAAGAAALIATSWSALVLAEFGWFTGAVPLLVGTAAFLGVLRAARPAPLRVTRAGFAVAACTLAVAVSSVPPGEIILGGWDPGVYVHTAAGIVRHGAVNFPSGDLADLSRQERRVVSLGRGRRAQPFPGMFLLPDGRVSPQFHHLYPALLAVGWSLAGIWGALLVNPLLATAAVPALYALARRVVPEPWAIAAPLALACNPATLWQAKFPTSEPLAQLLLVVGGALLFDALDGAAPPLVPVMAGTCLGAAFLARYDTLLVLIPLAVILAVLGVEPSRRRTVWLVAVPLAALVVHAVVHTRVAVPVYVPLRRVVGPGLAAVAALAAACVALALTRPGRRVARRLLSRAAALRTALALVVGAWAVLAWAVRPRVAVDWAGSALSRDFPGPDALVRFLAGPGKDDFLFLVDLMGAPGLVVALVALVVALRSAASPGRLALLLPATAVLLTLGSNVFHDRSLMWVLRRFVPVILPLLATCVALAAAAAARRCGRFGRRAALAGGGAVVALALLPNLGATAAMAKAREWPGLVRWYEGVVAAVPEGATVFTDLPGFGAPLRFIYSIRAYEYNPRDDSPTSDFFRVVRERADRGEVVFLLTRVGPPAAPGLVFEEEARFPLRTSAVGRPRHGIPRSPDPRVGVLGLYRVGLAPGAPEGAARPGEGGP